MNGLCADLWHTSTSTEALRMCAGNGKMPNGTKASEATALLSEDASAEEDSGQQTMVRVICSQRDRLKERVNQLGDELSKVDTLRRKSIGRKCRRESCEAPAVTHAVPQFPDFASCRMVRCMTRITLREQLACDGMMRCR